MSLPFVEPTELVFVAEDDADFRVALAEVLTEAGLRVVMFPTAEQLLRSLDLTIPAVIVTDVSMPGLSGPDLLRLLRLDDRWRQIPVVVMTANNDTALPIRLDAPVVYKPDTEGIVAVIQRLHAPRNPRPPPRSRVLVEDIADDVLDDTRKEWLAELATPPPLSSTSSAGARGLPPRQTTLSSS